MFADGFLANNIFEILGLIVTIGGIWLVVKQLNETRLATQMEGMLVLGEKFAASINDASILRELFELEEWKGLSDREAHNRVYDSKALANAYNKVLSLFELIGVLVRRKTLDRELAFDYYGSVASGWWNYLEKITRQRRIENNSESIGEHWEWLAKQFEAKT